MKTNKNDITSFIGNYKNENEFYRKNVVKRLRDLHTVYDEVQGYAKAILERDSDENRYLALKYITGCAIAVSKQQDEVIDAFVQYMEVQSAFWYMLKFEQDLRKFNRGQLDKDELKNLKNRLNNYRKAYAKMTEAPRESSRIGTSILYPLMAIVHEYNPYGKQDKDFAIMVSDFYECNVNIDVNPAPKNIDDAFEQFNKLIANSGIDVNVIVQPVQKYFVEVDNSANNDVLQNNTDNTVVSEYKYMSRLNKLVTEMNVESTKEAKVSQGSTSSIAEESNRDLTNLKEAPEYLGYANMVFANSNDFAGVSLDKFCYSWSQSIMGKVCKQQDIYPFAGAKNVEEVKEIYANLEDELKVIFMTEIFTNAVINSLYKDVNNFATLDEVIKSKVKALCGKDEKLNTMLEAKMRYADKQRNKEIRRLVRLSKRDDDYYGLASTRELN